MPPPRAHYLVQGRNEREIGEGEGCGAGRRRQQRSPKRHGGGQRRGASQEGKAVIQEDQGKVRGKAIVG
eukprot:CAMPEP_0174894430 /NCGR_PEP_ID=MMETSP0167-20121228/9071_1 /TAXON_ID=38298 /ORGANISM="Rhodella maculata, Strain CCMP736" /LENGTH=68 /DNA_ID=CAMNT_0016133513 /DNA_START=79 /DNA_END=283 /DNA_ORIENTATION=+